MRYYVTADVHGYLTPYLDALREAGYFDDPGEKKLLICGDLFDRGMEAKNLQDFVLEKMARDEIILVRGNHEDLFCDLVTKDKGVPYNHHVHNGTYYTALDLTGYELNRALKRKYEFASAARRTPFYTQIIPAMLDYYETEHYLFVHGWIPCTPTEGNRYVKVPNWRGAGEALWRSARWVNGMDAAYCGILEEGKTIVCGHWHCSYGHARYEKACSEFGADADFTPYYAPGIIALDACTIHSRKVNVIVLED